MQEGRQINLGDYASDVSWRPPFTGTADVPRLLAQWEAGATIVLQALHVSWHPLAVFCRALEEALGYGVQTNAYYTPRGSQGFAVHHDTHDVLILQVAGEKRWLLYDPLLELPLKHQRYSSALGEHGEPTDELVLRAGDSLYLPRGWLHQAETSSTDSLHLTVGIRLHTWIDAAKGALEACEDELAFRRGVDARRGGRPRRPDRRAARSRAGRAAAAPAVRPVAAADPRGRPLAAARAARALDADTLLERRQTVIADLEESPDGVALFFEGKEVRFPAAAATEVRAMLRERRAVPPSPICRASSTPTDGSCSRAASCAKASSGSADDVVRRDPPAAGAAGLGRVARQERGLVGERLGDVELVQRPRPACGSGRATTRRRRAPSRRASRSSMPVRPVGLAQRLLGGLHAERVRAAPAVALELDLSGRRRSEHARRVGGRDAAVVEAVREHDDVAGEAVAPDVRRLPDALRVGLVPQRVVDRPPVQRAAAVALAVRADEEQRPRPTALAAPASAAAKSTSSRSCGCSTASSTSRSSPGVESATNARFPACAPRDGRLTNSSRALGSAAACALRCSLTSGANRLPASGSRAHAAAVLDEDPVVDAAGRRRERLAALARKHRAERAPRLRRRWCGHDRNGSRACTTDDDSPAAAPSTEHNDSGGETGGRDPRARVHEPRRRDRRAGLDVRLRLRPEDGRGDRRVHRRAARASCSAARPTRCSSRRGRRGRSRTTRARRSSTRRRSTSSPARSRARPGTTRTSSGRTTRSGSAG